VATIVIHAGMPKTGSTSIQRWIAENSTRLREQNGVQVLVVASRTPDKVSDAVRLEPYEAGTVNSGALIKAWLLTGRSPAVARAFFEDLARYADDCSVVLLTSEALSQAFWCADETFLAGFEQLARAHLVRVAYYVRPQHAALEASWRESGFKQRKHEPAEWVLAQSDVKWRYLHTLDVVREIAPTVELDVRPFVPDLLDGGSPVEDFVRRFLSLDEECREFHANPGFPLELVNLLRGAPRGWFWRMTYAGVAPERYPRRKVRALLDGLELVASPSIRRSRLVLQQHCHEVFEDENQELIRRLGWPLSFFVPPVEDLDGEWSLDELDVLWAPEASEAERALLYHALRAALA